MFKFSTATRSGKKKKLKNGPPPQILVPDRITEKQCYERLKIESRRKIVLLRRVCRIGRVGGAGKHTCAVYKHVRRTGIGGVVFGRSRRRRRRRRHKGQRATV